MNPQVKQRIDQIRRGEVPEGYKKTKVGIVPSEWSCFTFGDLYVERKEAGAPELPILTVSIHSGVSDGALGEDEIGKKVKRIEDKTKYKKAHSGDLVFNMMRAWQGAIGVVRTKGLVSPAYIVAEPRNAVYPLYMDFYMKTAEVINRIHRKSYGVTDFRLRLYWDSFAIIDCALPPLPEQQKIAEILTTQDKLIELQERKIEQLQALKKAYLQRMFPKKGCDRPEIRFPEFTDAWEQRELGAICNYHSSSLTAKDVDENGNYDLYDANSIIGKTSKGYMSEDYVTIIKDGSGVGRTRLLPENTMFLGTMGALTPQNSNIDFLYQLITNADLGKSYTGSTIPHIYFKDYGKNRYCIPCYDEQEAIGTYFRNLDHLITLHEHKLNEEKQKKKALMQLLLTGIVRVKI